MPNRNPSKKITPMTVSRRLVLCAIGALPLHHQVASAFNRSAAQKQYQAWLKQLDADLRLADDQVELGQTVTMEDIGRWCVKSVVPGSRGAQNFSEFLNLLRQSNQSYDSRRGSFLTLALRLLENSVPAGQGGVYPEKPGSPFAHQTMTVWYMHINGGERLQRHFDNPNEFSPYGLPPEGEFRGKAYPFLLFEQQEREAPLRFGSFGREWWNVLKFIGDQQIA